MLSRLGTPQLLVSAAFLVSSGLVMVYSASAPRAALVFGSSGGYLWRQAGGLALGLAAAVVLARTPLHWIQKGGIPFWALSTLLVAATLTPLGAEANGASRWIALGPVTFQPLELAKLGVVLACASWLAAHQGRMADFRSSIAVPALFAAVPAALLLLQPDFGGAVMIIAFAGALIFTAGARIDHLAACGLLVLPPLAFVAMLAGYRRRLRRLSHAPADGRGPLDMARHAGCEGQPRRHLPGRDARCEPARPTHVRATLARAH